MSQPEYPSSLVPYVREASRAEDGGAGTHQGPSEEHEQALDVGLASTHTHAYSTTTALPQASHDQPTAPLLPPMTALTTTCTAGRANTFGSQRFSRHDDDTQQASFEARRLTSSPIDRHPPFLQGQQHPQQHPNPNANELHRPLSPGPSSRTYLPYNGPASHPLVSHSSPDVVVPSLRRRDERSVSEATERLPSSLQVASKGLESPSGGAVSSGPRCTSFTHVASSVDPVIDVGTLTTVEGWSEGSAAQRSPRTVSSPSKPPTTETRDTSRREQSSEVVSEVGALMARRLRALDTSFFTRAGVGSTREGRPGTGRSSREPSGPALSRNYDAKAYVNTRVMPTFSLRLGSPPMAVAASSLSTGPALPADTPPLGSPSSLPDSYRAFSGHPPLTGTTAATSGRGGFPSPPPHDGAVPTSPHANGFVRETADGEGLQRWTPRAGSVSQGVPHWSSNRSTEALLAGGSGLSRPTAAPGSHDGSSARGSSVVPHGELPRRNDAGGSVLGNSASSLGLMGSPAVSSLRMGGGAVVLGGGSGGGLLTPSDRSLGSPAPFAFRVSGTDYGNHSVVPWSAGSSVQPTSPRAPEPPRSRNHIQNLVRRTQSMLEPSRRAIVSPQSPQGRLTPSPGLSESGSIPRGEGARFTRKRSLRPLMDRGAGAAFGSSLSPTLSQPTGFGPRADKVTSLQQLRRRALRAIRKRGITCLRDAVEIIEDQILWEQEAELDEAAGRVPSPPPYGPHPPSLFGLFGMLERAGKFHDFSALYEQHKSTLWEFLMAVGQHVHALSKHPSGARYFDVLFHLLQDRNARHRVGEEFFNDPMNSWPCHMLYLVCCYRVTGATIGHERLFAAMKETGGIMFMGKGIFSALSVAMSPTLPSLARNTARMFLASFYVGTVLRTNQEKAMGAVERLRQRSFALLLVQVPIASLRMLLEEVNEGRGGRTAFPLEEAQRSVSASEAARAGPSPSSSAAAQGSLSSSSHTDMNKPRRPQDVGSPGTSYPNGSRSVHGYAGGGGLPNLVSSPAFRPDTALSPQGSGSSNRSDYGHVPATRTTAGLQEATATVPRAVPTTAYSQIEISRILSTRSAVVCGHPLDLMRLDVVLTRFADGNGVKMFKDYLPTFVPENSHYYNRDLALDVVTHWERVGLSFSVDEIDMTVFSCVDGEPFSSVPRDAFMRRVAQAATHANQDLTYSLRHIRNGDVLLDFSKDKVTVGRIIEWGEKEVTVLVQPADEIEESALAMNHRSQGSADMRRVLQRLSMINTVLQELGSMPMQSDTWLSSRSAARKERATRRLQRRQAKRVPEMSTPSAPPNGQEEGVIGTEGEFDSENETDTDTDEDGSAADGSQQGQSAPARPVRTAVPYPPVCIDLGTTFLELGLLKPHGHVLAEAASTGGAGIDKTATARSKEARTGKSVPNAAAVAIAREGAATSRNTAARNPTSVATQGSPPDGRVQGRIPSPSSVLSSPREGPMAHPRKSTQVWSSGETANEDMGSRTDGAAAAASALASADGSSNGRGSSGQQDTREGVGARVQQSEADAALAKQACEVSLMSCSEPNMSSYPPEPSWTPFRSQTSIRRVPDTANISDSAPLRLQVVSPRGGTLPVATSPSASAAASLRTGKREGVPFGYRTERLHPDGTFRSASSTPAASAARSDGNGSVSASALATPGPEELTPSRPPSALGRRGGGGGGSIVPNPSRTSSPNVTAAPQARFLRGGYVAHVNAHFKNVINVYQVAPLIKYYEMQFGVVLCNGAVLFAERLSEATGIDFPPYLLLMCPNVFALLELWDTYEFISQWFGE